MHVYIRYLVCCAIRLFLSLEYCSFLCVCVIAIVIGVAGFLNFLPSGGVALKMALVVDVV